MPRYLFNLLKIEECTFLQYASTPTIPLLKAPLQNYFHGQKKNSTPKSVAAITKTPTLSLFILASSMEQNQIHIHLFRADAAIAFVYKSISSNIFKWFTEHHKYSFFPSLLSSYVCAI